MERRKLTRRDFLRLSAIASTGAVLAACAPKVVKETVVVEKVLEKPVVETVVVEKVVEKPVEKVVTATPGPVHMRIWHHWTPPRQEVLQKALREFEKRHPGLTVEDVLVPQVGKHEKFLSAIAGGEPADVMMIGHWDLGMYVEENALMPLNGYMSRDDISPDIWFPGDFNPSIYKGNIWMLPGVGGGTQPIFFNVEHFEEVGLDPEKPLSTWDELEEAAEKLNIIEAGKFERMGFYPLCRGGYLTKERTWGFFITYNAGRGISLDGKTAVYDEAYQEALQWLLDFVDTYCGGFEEAQIFMEFARAGSGEFDAPFYNQRESMSIAGPWQFSIIPSKFPELKFDCMPVPYGPSWDPEYVTSGVGGTWCWAIPRGVKNPDAAWELLKWITAEEGCKIFTEGMKRPPALISVAEDPFWAEAIPQWPHYVEAMKRVPPGKRIPPFVGVDKVTDDMLENIMRHRMTVEEATDWAREETQKIIDEYWAKEAAG